MLTRSALAWLTLLVLAILNGAVRQALLVPRMGDRAGHIVSTLLLSVLILATTWVLLPWIRPIGPRDAWIIGVVWLLLTTAFEFLGGHYLFRTPWEQLLADYNVARGRIWILVLATTLLAPPLVRSWRH